MAGPWEKYAAPQPAQSGPWDKYRAPSEEQQEPEEPGFLESAIRTIDSYAGAPVRQAIGAAQDGQGVGGALKAGWKQMGEDPALAPSGDEIALRAGISGERRVRTAKEQQEFDEKNNPGLAASRKQMGYQYKDQESFSPAEVAGFGIEVGADLTNLIPGAALAKKGAVGAAKLATKATTKAANVADAAFRVGGSAGKRVMQGTLGVPEESITRYLERLPQLKDKVGAREMAEELAGRLDEGLKPFRAELSTAEEAVERAKASRSESLQELLVKRQEAAEALKRAEDQALGEAASELSSRVQQLNKKVSEGSAQSFKILDEEGVRVPVTPLKADLTKGINAMRPVTQEQVAVVEMLKGYRERLNQFGKDMPGGEAKRIIQSLDREMRHLAPGEVGRLGQDDQVLGILRRRFDAPLKASDKYAEQMATVAADTRTLRGAEDFASESAAARALRAAQSSAGKDKADAIRALQGGDTLITRANPKNLPEYHKRAGYVQAYREAKKGLPLKQAQTRLEGVRGRVGDAVALGEKGVAGIGDKISSVVRRTDPSAVSMESLKKVGDLTGINMADEIADLKTIASFEKGYTRGSANTNFWAAVAGGILGSVAGPGGAILGAGSGAAFGRVMVDNFGPKMARVILDQTPNLKRMNPSKWIRSLNVPPEVQAKLAQDLLAYRATGLSVRGGNVASKAARDTGNTFKNVAERDDGRETASAHTRGPDKWAADGMRKLGLDDPALLQSKDAKRLLIEASDLKPGSPRLKKIKEQIQKGISK